MPTFQDREQALLFAGVCIATQMGKAPRAGCSVPGSVEAWSV
jgi:hypothetical protein